MAKWKVNMSGFDSDSEKVDIINISSETETTVSIESFRCLSSDDELKVKLEIETPNISQVTSPLATPSQGISQFTSPLAPTSAGIYIYSYSSILSRNVLILQEIIPGMNGNLV